MIEAYEILETVNEVNAELVFTCCWDWYPLKPLGTVNFPGSIACSRCWRQSTGLLH